MVTLPDTVETFEVLMWGAGGSGGAQLGATGGGGAGLRFIMDSRSGSQNLVIWVGEGGGQVGSGGGGSFVYSMNSDEPMNLLAVAAGGGAGGTDGNSGRSYIGGSGGAGGAASGQNGQAITGHQPGTPSTYCFEANGGSGATLVTLAKVVHLAANTVNGCNGLNGAERLGASVTSSGLFDSFRCVENMSRTSWALAPAQGNGGGGGGGGGYYGGGSGGFVHTYCGGGGGGGSSWINDLAQNQMIEAGQAQTPGFLMMGQGAGEGGAEDSHDLPVGDLSYQGQSGRVVIRW